jgi:hypothetical protein
VFILVHASDKIKDFSRRVQPVSATPTMISMLFSGEFAWFSMGGRVCQRRRRGVVAAVAAGAVAGRDRAALGRHAVSIHGVVTGFGGLEQAVRQECAGGAPATGVGADAD